MYLPQSLPLCSPPLAVWTGETGKRYDFAVLRTGTAWIDAPAVYVLARHEDSRPSPLFVGETSSLHLLFGAHRDRCAEEWRTAMAGGMTHVHVRFEAMSAAARAHEVADLIASLRPSLNAAPDATPDATPGAEAMPETMPETIPDAMPADPHAVDELEATGAPAGDHPTVRVPYRAHRLSPSRPGREAGEAVTPQWLDEPWRPAWQLRADPARDADTGFDVDAASAANAPVVALVVEPIREAEVEPLPVAAVAAVVSPTVAAVDAAAPTPSGPSAPSAEATPAEAIPAEHTPRRRGGLLARLFGWVVGRTPIRPAASEAIRHEPQPEIVPAPPTQPVATPEAAAAAPAETVPAAVVAAAEPAPDPAPAPAPAAAPAAEPATPEPVAAAPNMAVAADARTEAPLERATAAKRALRLDPQAPVVLFAGDMGRDGGVDILFEAMLIVCAGHAGVQFVYAGEGPLRSELQERAGRAALGERCRFLGDVPAERFPPVLAAADFVAIPAREPQGDELARQALTAGKPVLVTHQSGIRCVAHGRNGLVTYDNPGSFVWGVRELLGPLYGTLLRQLEDARLDGALDRAA